MKNRMMTPAQVKSYATEANPDPVSFAVMYINSRLAHPKTASATSTVYQVTGIPVRLTPAQVLQLRDQCRAAGWKSVQVVVWREGSCVTLDANCAHGNWECAIDGVELSQLTEMAA